MKISRSTSRPRRLKRHRGAGGAWVTIAALLVVGGGAAYVGNELGWWSANEGKAPREAGRTSPREANRAAPETQIAAVTPAPPPDPRLAQDQPKLATDPPGGVVVPAAPITIPVFGREFEDALARGAFRDAEGALAKIGGAADAERRLGAAMDAARARIAARFEEISKTSGDRAARLYVTRQIESFPERADARRALQSLIAVSESAPTEGNFVIPDSRPAQTRPSSPEGPDTDLQAMKDEAARVLGAGEVKAALSVLREVASAAEARHDQAILLDAQRLVRQGEAELRLRQAIIDRVAKKEAGDRAVPHLPGERGQILTATDDGMTFSSAKGQVSLKWRILPVHSLSAIIQILELTPSELTDAAATLYRAGHATEADALLARALQGSGPDVKQAIDQTLADARGMSLPPGGFRLMGEKWLSPQEYARHAVANDIAQSTKDLAAPDAAARRTAFVRMVKLGDAAKSPLHRALLLRRAEIREEIQKAPSYAKLAELGAHRRELDEARAHALDLIEDEKKYPYPYRPPEASPEQYKAYQEAQREIDARVAKLRGLWNTPIALPLPKPFKDKVALLAEVATFLSELGVAPIEPDPGWLLFLPAADEVTLQTVATSESDRKRIDESAEVMKLNLTRPTKPTKGESDQARITNEYRVMFGRAAVMVHDLLTIAAHGHCEDMTRLGFFAHESPVPGKRTPTDRIRLTGMDPMGASENIAQASGPSGAHNGWCHSSGHHRNLLAAGWKLIGVGNAGHTWCQNFAAGEVKPFDDGHEGGEAK